MITLAPISPKREVPTPPTDTEARDLFDTFDTLQGAERETAAERLRLYRDEVLAPRQREEAEAAIETRFRDFDTMGGAWDEATMRPIMETSLDPEQEKAAMANLAFIAHREGKPIHEVKTIYPALRDRFARDAFGKNKVSDREFYDLVAGDFEKKRQRAAAMAEIPQDLAAARVAGQDISPMAIVGEWKQRHPEWAGTTDETQALAQAQMFATKADEWITKNAKIGDAINRTLAAWTGKDGKAVGGEAMTMLADELTKLSPEDRQAAYGVAALLAARSGNAKGFFEQLGESVGRSVGELGRSAAGYIEEQLLDDEIRAANGETLPRMTMGQGPVVVPPAPATPEERASRKAAAERRKAAIVVQRELREIAAGTIDPIKPLASGWLAAFAAFEEGVYGAAGSLPYLAIAAIPVAGTPLAMTAYTATEYDRVRREYPTVPLGQAQGMALISGGVQGAVYRLQVENIAGKLPLTAALFGQLAKPTPRFWGPWAAKMGLNLAEQNIQEAAQDFTPVVVDAVAKTLGTDMPGYDWAKDLEDFKGSRAQTFFALLPLWLIGAGAGTAVQQSRQMRAFFADPANIERVGVPREIAASIAAEPDATKQAKAFQAAWRNVPREKKQAIIAEANQATAESEQRQNDPGEPTLTVERQADGSDVWKVRDRDGKELYASTDEEAALTAYAAHAEHEARRVLLGDEAVAEDAQNGALQQMLSQGTTTPDWLTSEAANAMKGFDGSLPAVSRKEAERALADVSAGGGGVFQYVDPEELDPSRKRSLEAAGRLSALFGRRVVVYRNAENPGINGVTNAKHRGIVFLSADSTRPHWVVAGHELWHHVELSNPTLARDVAAAIWSDSIRRDQYLAEKSNYSKDRIPHELTADILGDSFGDERFWRMLADRNPSVFQRFARVVRDWLQKVGQAIRRRGLQGESFTKDFARAQSMLADVMASFASGAAVKPDAYEVIDANQNFYSIDSALAKLDTDPEYRRQVIARARQKLAAIEARTKPQPKLTGKQKQSAIDEATTAHAQAVADIAKQETAALEGVTDGRERNRIKFSFGAKRSAADSRLEKAIAAASGAGVSRAGMLRSLGELEAIRSVLPADVRAKVGNAKKLAEFKTDKAREKYLASQVEKMGAELEKYLRKDYRRRIERALDKSRPKRGENRVQKSTLGPEAQRAADAAYRATLLDAEATAERLSEIEGALAGDLTPERQSELVEEWSIVNTFGDLANRDADTLATALEWLEGTIKEGRGQWRMQEEARRNMMAERRKEVVAKIGKPGRRAVVQADQKTGVAAFTEWLKSGVLSHFSFLQILDQVIPGGTDTVKEWTRRVRQADTATQDFARAASDRLTSALQAALGSKSARRMGDAMWDLKQVRDGQVQAVTGREVKNERIAVDIAEKIVRGEADRGELTNADVQALREALQQREQDLADRDAEAVEGGNDNARMREGSAFVTITRVVKEGTREAVPMSRLDAIQYLLSWDQPDVRAKMEMQGWSESSIEQMRAMTADPMSQAVLDFLRAEYAAGYGRTNPIYRRMFGMDMPQVKNYAPTRYENAKDAPDIGLYGSPIELSGVTPGFAKSRVSHNAMLRQMDALTVYWQHVAQQAHFIHYAELTRELRGVLQSPDVRRGMEARFGRAMVQQVDFWLEALATQGGSKSNELIVDQKMLDMMISGKAVASLGGAFRTVLMQVDSALRFVFAMPTRDIVRALADAPAAFAQVPAAWRSASVQRRLVNGASPEARYLFERNRVRPSFMGKIAEYAMMPIQYADAFLTSVSGAIVYRDAYTRAKEGGAPDNIAEQAAADAMDDAIYRYSQPVALANRSLREVSGNRILKIFMMFLSDARLKTALTAEAVLGLINGTGNRKEHVRRIVAVQAMAMVSHVLSNLYRDGFSDDTDEEIWTWEGFVRAAALAPLSGYFFVGAAADVAFSDLLGERWFADSENPLVGTATQGLRAASNLGDAWNPDDPDAMLKEWNAIARTVAIAGPASAVPAVVVNIIKPIVGAAENADSDE